MVKPRPPRGRLDWGMLIAGAVILYFCIRTMWLGYASTHWPRVDAVITKSEPRYGPRVGRFLEVSYEYDCVGKRCTGHRWHYKLFSDSPDALFVRSPSATVDAALTSYPEGQHVKVAVKPGDVSESVLEPGVSRDDCLWALGGIVFALRGLLPGREERFRSARA